MMKRLVSFCGIVFLTLLLFDSTCLGQELAGASSGKVTVTVDPTDKYEMIRSVLLITRASNMAKQNSAELFSYNSNNLEYKLLVPQSGNKCNLFKLNDSGNTSETITLYKPVMVDINQWKALAYKKQSFSYIDLSQALLGELLYVIATSKYSNHNFNFAPKK